MYSTVFYILLFLHDVIIPEILKPKYCSKTKLKQREWPNPPLHSCVLKPSCHLFTPSASRLVGLEGWSLIPWFWDGRMDGDTPQMSGLGVCSWTQCAMCRQLRWLSLYPKESISIQTPWLRWGRYRYFLNLYDECDILYMGMFFLW